MTPLKGLLIFDRYARHYLRMSGREFVAKLDAGYFKGKPQAELHQVDHVYMMLPLVRDVWPERAEVIEHGE